MSSFYVMTHPLPKGAHAGWSFCAITDCECTLPKICLNSNCHCSRQKGCTRNGCECGWLKVCDSPFCECDRPKVITESYGRPIKVLMPSIEENYAMAQKV
jgi:hypothetical protein